MDNKEKNFKILKLKNLDKRIRNQENTIYQDESMLVVSAVVSAFLFYCVAHSDKSETAKFVGALFGLVGTGFSIFELRKLIEEITTKTKLENKFEDVFDELRMDNEKVESKMLRKRYTNLIKNK